MSRRRTQAECLPGFGLVGALPSAASGAVVELVGEDVPPSLASSTRAKLHPHRCKPGRLCTPSRPRCAWMRRRAARPRDHVCDCSAGASYPHRSASVAWCEKRGGGLDALMLEYDRRRGVR
jgi:hypothetical protein